MSLVDPQAAPPTWYEFVCQYTDSKWAQTSPHHREGTAEPIRSI